METQIKNETKKDAKNDEGFTLIEMMVVLFIIMLLSSAVYFTVAGNQDRAVEIKANSDIQRLSQALEMYRLDMLDYPPEDYGLEALRSLPSGIDTGDRYNKEGYVKTLPTDPWGRPYVYRYPGENGVYDILSYGSDGQPGGEEMAADITNWDE